MDFLDANLRNLGPVEVMLVPFVAPLIQLVSLKAQDIISKAREAKPDSTLKKGDHSAIQSSEEVAA